jgi:hypothetical protein
MVKPAHDRSLYHRLFSHPLMMEQLVRAFVPEAMAAGLQFDRMERVNAKVHAEALNGTIQRRDGDVIWRLWARDDRCLCQGARFRPQIRHRAG